MPSGRVAAAVAGVVLVLGSVFFFAPVVPYTGSLVMSYQTGAVGCPGPAANGTEAAYCHSELASATEVVGYATPAYRALGYGARPFESQVEVTQGNHSALVFFQGDRPVAAEDTGGPGVLVQPLNTVYIPIASVAGADYGLLNLTIRLQNFGLTTITHPSVYLSMAGFSTNYTTGGLTWIVPRAVGDCPADWESGAYCRLTEIVPNSLPVNQTVNYTVEVRGELNGTAFVFRQAFQVPYPTGGVGPLWVAAFVSSVNAARGGVNLVHNATLDSFAHIRFENASAHYQVSDYGFANDSLAFFGPDHPSPYDQEVLLYPLSSTPDGYAGFLSSYAPGHWAALTDTSYRQYGFYIGVGPYYAVAVPCSVYEIPHGGLNIAQFFKDHGCITSLTPATWLVIVLTP